MTDTTRDATNGKLSAAIALEMQGDMELSLIHI